MTRKNKTILLTGFFGEGNMGDESILKAICDNLPSDITPIITSGSKQDFGISIRRRGIFSWPSFLKAAYNSPITLFTGGILQDWSWEGVTFFAYRIIAAAKMSSTPVLFGTGLGPLRSEKAKKLVKKALSFVKIAYVRDKTSYDLYKSLLPNSNVKLGTDWTWHFPIVKQNKHDSNRLVANLREWKDSSLLNKALEEINAFEGSKIGLAARKGDIKLLQTIPNMSEILCPNRFIEFSQNCKNCSHGIAMRYHAALAMLRAGLPVKLVCYDDKVKDLAVSAGMVLNKNSISLDFNTPTCDFFSKNEELYLEMKKSFLEVIKQKYDII
ncbi:MAG: polysaccharide pyruvyl transferase family protein [Candidatus Riflebacteria bacterium]|nr:polysaccharide pyruvyl transferase family protein [Candidatus Riflebacteria bacterium]MBR4571719.1 polysaccharide pyruvyl transferase family protein [Candidatus Riflebacteria bacterium]